MQKSWLILIAVIAVIGIVLGGIGLSKLNVLSERLSALEEAYPIIKATISIDYGDIMRAESHELVLPAVATAWDALNKIAKVEILRSEEGKASLLEINGISKGKNHEDHDWALYLNKMRIPLSLSAALPLEDGIHVLFIYEKLPEKIPEEGKKEGG